MGKKNDKENYIKNREKGLKNASFSVINSKTFRPALCIPYSPGKKKKSQMHKIYPSILILHYLLIRWIYLFNETSHLNTIMVVI